MGKILRVLLVGFFLLIPAKISAKDYKTIFRIQVLAGDKAFASDGTNKEMIDVPLTPTLAQKGWICKLMPRTTVRNPSGGLEYVQTIECLNNINGDMVGTIAHCPINQEASGQGVFMLDHHDKDVVRTNAMVSCVTIGGDSI